MSTRYDHWKAGDFDPAQEDLDELIEERTRQYAADPAKVAEADEWCEGSFDGEHYSAVERALADLGDVEPQNLLGSDALAAILRLAPVHTDARRKHLRNMAEGDILAEIERSRNEQAESRVQVAA